jgi:hypothetical protein
LVDFSDFADDWGYTLPISTKTTGVFHEILENQSKEFDEQPNRETEVILRVTELLLNLPLQQFEESSPLFTLLQRNLPASLEPELRKYENKGSTSEERSWNFSNNMMEKILMEYIERCKSRTSLEFKSSTYDELLEELNKGIESFADRKRFLDEYYEVLANSNELSQNRRAVLYFAQNAGIPLTEPVIMNPFTTRPPGNGLESTQYSRNTMWSPRMFSGSSRTSWW